MRHTPRYLMTDEEEVKRLIRDHPWATFVSATSTGLVASHYPVLLDEAASGITVLTHFGRPDDELHELGRHEVLVVVQGPHDYVSPSWYAPWGTTPAMWLRIAWQACLSSPLNGRGKVVADQMMLEHVRSQSFEHRAETGADAIGDLLDAFERGTDGAKFVPDCNRDNAWAAGDGDVACPRPCRRDQCTGY